MKTKSSISVALYKRKQENNNYAICFTHKSISTLLSESGQFLIEEGERKSYGK